MIRIAIEKPCDNEFGALRCELANGHTGPHGCATSWDEDGRVDDGVTWDQATENIRWATSFTTGAF